MSRVWRALCVRPGEERLVGLLFATSFCVGLARVLLLSAAGAIFLDSQPLEAIPRLYVLMGVGGATIGVLVGRAQGALPFGRFLAALLVGVAAVTMVLWAALWAIGAAPLALGIGAWSYVVETLLLLAGGAVVGRALDLRQAKRIGPVAGAGQTAAEVAGGLSVAALVAVVGVQGLLPVASAAVLAGLFVALRVGPARGAEADPPEQRVDGGAMASTGPLARPYVRVLVLLVVLDTVLYLVLDGGFWAEVKTRFGEGDALAGFFGLAFAGVSAVTLVARTVLAARVMRRWGLLAGLAALPLLALPGAAAVLAVAPLGLGAAALFWLFTVARLSYDVAYDALYYPANQVLFDALPPRERLAALSFAETVAKPASGALAGLLLMALLEVDAIRAATVAPVAVALMLGLLALSLVARRGYVTVLRGSLHRRLLGRGAAEIRDATSMAILEQALLSPHDGVALSALHRLEQIEDWDAHTWLVRLLAHPSPGVRLEALRRVERGEVASAVEAMQHLVGGDPDPIVREAALRALVAVSDDHVAEVEAYLAHADPRLRRGALVGLVLHGGIGGMVAAGRQLMALGESPNASDRRLLAEAIGEIGARQLHRLLDRLLADGDADVRRAALRAAGRVRHPGLWPTVARALNDPTARGAAAQALVAGGPDALPVLAAMLDDPEAERDVRRQAVAILARMEEPAAAELLAARLDHPDLPVRDALLRALAARPDRRTAVSVTAARRQLEAELQAVAWNLAALIDLDESIAAAGVLRSALEREVARGRERVLFLLALHDARPPILEAVRTLTVGAAGESQAVEVLDNLVERSLKLPIMALVEPGAAAARLMRMGPTYRQARLDPDARLRAIIDRSGAWLLPWTRACAIAAGAQLGQRCWRRALAAAAVSGEPLVRETVAWVLPWAGMDAQGWEAVEMLRADKVPNVAAMAAYAAEVAEMAEIAEMPEVA